MVIFLPLIRSTEIGPAQESMVTRSTGRFLVAS